MPFLNRLNRKSDSDFITDIRRVLAHIEIGAFDHGRCIGAARVFFQYRMRHTPERSDSQRDRFADPFEVRIPSTETGLSSSNRN
jgi:hypothetical protein